jgi:hypothetical protein
MRAGDEVFQELRPGACPRAIIPNITNPIDEEGAMG